MDTDNKSVKGIITRKGKHIQCRSVVLSTGTFLNGECHIGKYHVPAGRFFVIFISILYRSVIHLLQILQQYILPNSFILSTYRFNGLRQEHLLV